MHIQAHGLRIAVEDQGPRTGPVVLLIMGLGMQLIAWPQPLVQSLRDQGFRVVRFDNRDIGLSQGFDDAGVPSMALAALRYALHLPVHSPYRLADMAQDAVAVLDALGIAQAHVCGASMGGMIAQIVAAKHGGHARSMTSIMSTTGRPGLPQAAPEVQAALITPPADNGREGRIAHFKTMFTTIGSPGFRATEAELDALAAAVVDRAPYDPAGIARQLVAIMSSEPRHELLKGVTCPALVLHGEARVMVKIEGGKDTAASIPGATFVGVPGMGHDFTEALMPVFLEHVGGFIAGVEAKAKAA